MGIELPSGRHSEKRTGSGGGLVAGGMHCAMSSLKVAHARGSRGSLSYLKDASAISGKAPLMADVGPEGLPASYDAAERRRKWTTFTVYLAAVVERADEQILPALYFVCSLSHPTTIHPMHSLSTTTLFFTHPSLSLIHPLSLYSSHERMPNGNGLVMFTDDAVTAVCGLIAGCHAFSVGDNHPGEVRCDAESRQPSCSSCDGRPE
jgi:hypothetical protein